MAGPTDANALLLQVSADIRQLEKQFKKAAGIVDDGSNKMKRKATELEKQFEKIGASIGDGIKKASLAASVALGAIIGYSIKAAASANEMRDAFKIAFKDGAKGAEDFAAALSKKVGRSQLDIMESMTRFRLLFRDQAAGVADEMTKALQERAIDVGSLFDKKDEVVLQKFFSGITGESEPLKELGVIINDTAMKAELLRLGFKGNTQAASETAKQIARANIILAQTKDAAGNAADTIGSTANQFKKLQGEVKDSAAKLGEQFLPIANDLLKWASKALEAFNELPRGMQLAGLSALALVAAGGPILKLIAGFNTLIKAAVAARAAMIAAAAVGPVAGAATGAGVAGGAAVGAGLGGAAAGVAAGGAVLSLGGDTVAQKRLDDQTRLNNLIASEIRYRKTAADLEAKGRTAQAQQLRDLAEKTKSIIGGLRLKIDIAALPVGGPQADPTLAANGAPQFTLSDAQKKAVGGGGGGGRAPKGTKNDPITVEALHAETGFDPLTGKQLPTFEDRQVDDFQRALHPTGEDIAPDFGRLDPFQNIDEGFREAAERAAQIAEDAQQQWHDSVKDGILGGLHAAADGDLTDYLKYKLRAAIFDAAAEGLTNAFRTALNSASGSSNPILSGIGRVLGFASGTNYAPGGLAVVGERGPELVNLPRGAQVVPNNLLKSLGSGPSQQIYVTTPVHLHAEGAVMTPELVASWRREIAASHQAAVRTAVGIASRGLPGRAQQASRLGT